jgi:NAD(P)-dependent dehydrogenase (short-subunit alcohol dehydrogenase family)
MTEDRTAIVTGANHGIGAATAVALARRGCAVLCATTCGLRTRSTPASHKPTGITGHLHEASGFRSVNRAVDGEPRSLICCFNGSTGRPVAPAGFAGSKAHRAEALGFDPRSAIRRIFAVKAKR